MQIIDSHQLFVELWGFEPQTFALPARRSSQLSYSPFFQDLKYTVFSDHNARIRNQTCKGFLAGIGSSQKKFFLQASYSNNNHLNSTYIRFYCSNTDRNELNNSLTSKKTCNNFFAFQCLL